jgi:hypothetical protein
MLVRIEPLSSFIAAPGVLGSMEATTILTRGDPDFTFRGSLGPRLVGYEQFVGYVKFVTGSLDHYTSDILALAEEGNQVFGKLRFHGYHRQELFEVQPTGRHVWWYGTPIFTFDGGLVRDLWVLGDIHGLIGRLKGASSETEA